MNASIHHAPVTEVGPSIERTDAPAVVSIAPFFRLLGRYHRVLLLGLLGLVVAWGAGVLLLRSVLPGVTTSSLGIRFSFQGVSAEQYPNGLRFSPNDVISPEVLEQVYLQNDLKDILPFDRFKKSVFITQSNRDLDQLESEYAIKLRDSRLSSPERRQLEQEFMAASEGLRTDSYLLSYRADGDSRLPAPLYEQVLLAIPVTWAELAAERRGVLSYDIEIATAGPAMESGYGMDKTLETVEFLRLTTANLSRAAALVAKLPGANLARGEGGETVADLTTELNVFGSLTIMPLYLMGTRLAAANDPAMVESLLASHLEAERRLKAAADSRASDLDRALQVYLSNAAFPETPAGGAADGAAPGAARGAPASAGASGVIAQVGGGFIEDIMRARDAAQDIKYRQKLNDKVVEAKMKAVDASLNVAFAAYVVEQIRRPAEKGAVPDAALFDEQARAAGERLRNLAERLRVLYDRISQRNLNPGSTLFAINRPFFTAHTAAVAGSSALLGGFGFVTLGMLVLIAACAAHDHRTRPRAG